jgi:hypothetical protein
MWAYQVISMKETQVSDECAGNSALQKRSAGKKRFF